MAHHQSVVFVHSLKMAGKRENPDNIIEKDIKKLKKDCEEVEELELSALECLPIELLIKICDKLTGDDIKNLILTSTRKFCTISSIYMLFHQMIFN